MLSIINQKLRHTGGPARQSVFLHSAWLSVLLAGCDSNPSEVASEAITHEEDPDLAPYDMTIGEQHTLRFAYATDVAPLIGYADYNNYTLLEGPEGVRLSDNGRVLLSDELAAMNGGSDSGPYEFVFAAEYNPDFILDAPAEGPWRSTFTITADIDVAPRWQSEQASYTVEEDRKFTINLFTATDDDSLSYVLTTLAANDSFYLGNMNLLDGTSPGQYSFLPDGFAFDEKTQTVTGVLADGAADLVLTYIVTDTYNISRTTITVSLREEKNEAPKWVQETTSYSTAYGVGVFSITLPVADDFGEVLYSVQSADEGLVSFSLFEGGTVLHGAVKPLTEQVTITYFASDERLTASLTVTIDITDVPDEVIGVQGQVYGREITLSDVFDSNDAVDLDSLMLLNHADVASLTGGVLTLGATAPQGAYVFLLEGNRNNVATTFQFDAVINPPPQWGVGSESHSALSRTLLALTLPEASDDDPLVYSLLALPEGLSFDGDTRVLTGDYAGLTDSLTLDYLASDEASTVTLAVTLGFADTLLLWDGSFPPLYQGTEGVDFEFALPAATGGTGSAAALSYALASLPDDWTFDAATRIISGTSTTAGAGLTILAYEASDDATTIMTSISFYFEENPAPEWTQSTFSYEALSAQSFTVTLPEATDDQAVEYALSSLPASWTFDAQTRVLTGLAPTSETTLSYTANDGYQSSTIEIVIEPTNNVAPIWDSFVAEHVFPIGTGGTVVLPTATDVENVSYSIFYQYGINGSPQDLSISSNVPIGLTYDEMARSIAFSIDFNQNAVPNLLIVSANDGSLTSTVTLTVALGDDPEWNDSEVFALSMVQNTNSVLELPTPVSQYALTSDRVSDFFPHNPIYSPNTVFSYTLDAVPEGMTFDSATGYLSGVYTGSETEFMLDYTVSDAVGSVSMTLTIDVMPNPAWAADGEVFFAEAGTRLAVEYVLGEAFGGVHDRGASPVTLYNLEQEVISSYDMRYDGEQVAFLLDLVFAESQYYVLLPGSGADALDGELSLQSVQEAPDSFDAPYLGLDDVAIGSFVGNSAISNDLGGADKYQDEYVVYLEADREYRIGFQTDTVPDAHRTIEHIDDADIVTMSDGSFSFSFPRPLWQRETEDEYSYSPASINVGFGEISSAGLHFESHISSYYFEALPNTGETVSYTVDSDLPGSFDPFAYQANTLRVSQTGFHTLTLESAVMHENYAFSFREEAEHNNLMLPPMPDEPSPEEQKEYVEAVFEALYYDEASAGTSFINAEAYFFNVKPDTLGMFYLPDGTTSTSPVWDGALPVLQFHMDFFPYPESSYTPLRFGFLGEDEREFDPSTTEQYMPLELDGEVGVDKFSFAEGEASFDFYVDVAALQAEVDLRTPSESVVDYIANWIYFGSSEVDRVELVGFADEDGPDSSFHNLLDFLDPYTGDG